MNTYTVRVRNRKADLGMLVDYIRIIDDTNPLTEGRYENDHPLLITGHNSGGGNAWTTKESSTATDGDFLQTLLPEKPDG